MKKWQTILILIFLLAPAIINAAWWNPLSWFDGWSFFSFSDPQTEVLEERVQELEKKLEERNGTSTESDTSSQDTSRENTNQEGDTSETVSDVPVVSQPKTEYSSESFTSPKIERVVLQEEVMTSTAVNVELCKTKAKTEVDRLRKNGLNKISQEIPHIVAIAKARNNQETETAALEHGVITQKDIVRSADVFKELLEQGVDLETAGNVAESEGEMYWTYLQNLNDWANSELNKILVPYEQELKNDENIIYAECLRRL